MGNYEQLKEAIKVVIKTNGKQEITGQVMQDTLLAITSSFGQGALFAGIAIPETNPLTPDQNVFYLASQSGVYPNFNDLSVADGEIVVFSLSNGQWTKQILSLGGGGVESGIKRQGVFNNKPSNPSVGFPYFCIDKQTTEGATNGIVIYYKGNNVWVDSLGRIVDNNYPIVTKGTTAERPTDIQIGFQYYDTTLKKYIVWNGTNWTNMDGTAL